MKDLEQTLARLRLLAQQTTDPRLVSATGISGYLRMGMEMAELFGELDAELTSGTTPPKDWRHEHTQ